MERGLKNLPKVNRVNFGTEGGVKHIGVSLLIINLTLGCVEHLHEILHSQNVRE